MQGFDSVKQTNLLKRINESKPDVLNVKYKERQTVTKYPQLTYISKVPEPKTPSSLKPSPST